MSIVRTTPSSAWYSSFQYRPEDEAGIARYQVGAEAAAQYPRNGGTFGDPPP
jgi:hypothetical protein